MHDVVIIGAGPAGLSAALWCDELGLDTLVLERADEIGGQLLSIHNPILDYLGARAANGRELCDAFATQIEAAEFDLWTGAEIESIDLRAKRVVLRSGETIQSIALILATGVRRRRLGIPGEVEFAGRGVMESGVRDRESFRSHDVCIVGGGDAAAENALLLADVCATVTMIHRGAKLRARREFYERIQANHRITLFTESRLLRIIGSDRVEAVELMREGAIKPMQIAVRGVLVRIGVEPNVELFRDQLETDSGGYVSVNADHETSVANVFGVGDLSNPLAPTIAGAVGAGATAAKVIAARLNATTK